MVVRSVRKEFSKYPANLDFAVRQPLFYTFRALAQSSKKS